VDIILDLFLFLPLEREEKEEEEEEEEEKVTMPSTPADTVAFIGVSTTC
jgi:hypothetical protein